MEESLELAASPSIFRRVKEIFVAGHWDFRRIIRGAKGGILMLRSSLRKEGSYGQTKGAIWLSEKEGSALCCVFVGFIRDGSDLVRVDE